MTNRPTPAAMPLRRVSQPVAVATQHSSAQRGRRGTAGSLTTPLGTIVMRLDTVRRNFFDEVAEKLKEHGRTVPQGKISPRWKEETIAGATVLIEQWFNLAGSGAIKVNVAPGVLKMARNLFVEACLKHNITNLPVQQEDWYVDLVAAKKTPVIDQFSQERIILAKICSQAASYLRHSLSKSATGGQLHEKTAAAIELLELYFFGGAFEEAEKNCDNNTLLEVRRKFAYACLRHRLSGVPGQTAGWYDEVAVSTQRFIESLQRK